MQMEDFLKEKRVLAGLSQRDVADELGYSTPQFISNWERGESHPPVDQLKKLAALYDVPAEDVFELLLDSRINLITEGLKKKFFGSSKKSSRTG